MAALCEALEFKNRSHDFWTLQSDLGHSVSTLKNP